MRKLLRRLAVWYLNTKPRKFKDDVNPNPIDTSKLLKDNLKAIVYYIPTTQERKDCLDVTIHPFKRNIEQEKKDKDNLNKSLEQFKDHVVIWNPKLNPVTRMIDYKEGDNYATKPSN